MGQGMKNKIGSLNLQPNNNIQQYSTYSNTNTFVNANINTGQQGSGQTVIGNQSQPPPLKTQYVSQNPNKSQSTSSYSYGAFNANMKRFS